MVVGPNTWAELRETKDSLSLLTGRNNTISRSVLTPLTANPMGGFLGVRIGT